MQLLIDQLMTKDSEIAKHALLRISGLKNSIGDTVSFSAISTTQLSFNMGNSWTNISDLTSATSEQAVAAAQVIQTYMEKAGIGTGAKTYTPIFSGQYIELWKGPVKPSFSVDIIVINYKGNDVRKEIQTLYSSVLPGGTAAGLNAATLLNTPLNYLSDGSRGTLMVEIGKWFRATDLLVDSVTSTFSKEIVKDGNGGSSPLYATASIMLKPRQAITYGDFLGFFKNATGTLV